MQSKLQNGIDEAIANSDPQPANEVETCNRVIYPLLLAAGYSHHEISAHKPDPSGRMPDYTLLPDVPAHTWFLEAKAWSVNLDDSHVQQALNYANNQGKRWVVLTNGRDWKLYDNHITGPAKEKLVAQSALRDVQFVNFLEAISKSFITSGNLEAFVQNQKLYSTLSNQLNDSDSVIIKEIWKIVKRQPEFQNVTANQIVAFFGGRHSDPMPTPPNICPAAGAPRTTIESQDAATSSWGETLTKVSREQVTGKKPKSLSLPDGTEIKAHTWRDVTVELARHVLSKGLLTNLPLLLSGRTSSHLIARAGTAEMRTPSEINVAGEKFDVETHFSAFRHIKAWEVILAKSGLSASDCRLNFAD